jgi:hypothetical protein
MALALGVLVLVAEPVQKRRPTIHVRPYQSGWSLYMQRPQMSLRGKRALRQRAEACSRGVFDLLAEYKRTDPGRDPWWHADDWDHISEARAYATL